MPFHPGGWQSISNDVFNLEGGNDRSIKKGDPTSVSSDLPSAWRRIHTSGLENA